MSDHSPSPKNGNDASESTRLVAAALHKALSTIEAQAGSITDLVRECRALRNDVHERDRQIARLRAKAAPK